MEPTKYIRDYFTGEKNAGFALIGIALLMTLIAVVVFRMEKGSIVYGISCGLIPLAIIQLFTGVITVGHAIVQHSVILKNISVNPQSSLIKEHDRMAEKSKRFSTIRKIQEIIFVLSLVCVVLGMAKVLTHIHLGFAMAILLQVGVMIAYDLFAARRSEEYLRRLGRTVGV